MGATALRIMYGRGVDYDGAGDRGGDVMATNFERIASSPEALADQLLISDLDAAYCKNLPKCCNDPDNVTAEDCRKYLLDWLAAPVKGGTNE